VVEAAGDEAHQRDEGAHEAGEGRRPNEIDEFLGAAIRNDNTRKAYIRALASFFGFLEDNGVQRVQDVGPLDVAAYLEALKRQGVAIATQKQHMAAIRMLLDHLVTGGVLEFNPALSVKAPRQSVRKGKTPVLTADEAGELLRSIETDSVIGLRDRALIGVMVFTFARVSAACAINVGDVFRQQRRLWVRLHEKGDKFHEMPCHHTLEGYLSEYMEAAELDGDPKAALFQSIDKHTRELSGERFTRVKAWEMVQRRAKQAGIETEVCNHTFRGTGITTYLENGGTLEKARQMAAHASTRTTQIYDRREDRVTLDEVVKINIRG
jgi:site-specific recombinase XerD